MSLEGTGKVAQKQENSVKKNNFKAFMKTQVFVRRRAIQEGMLIRFWWMKACFFSYSVFLSPSPSTGSWTDPSLSCGWRAAGQSVCLSYVFAWVCPSALVSVVIVHGGRDAGDYRGASSCCKVTCDSWTYRWQEEGDDSVKLRFGGKTRMLMMLYMINEGGPYSFCPPPKKKNNTTLVLG